MFRFIKSALLAVLVLIAFNSCEKELSKELGTDDTQGTQSGSSIYTLDGQPFTCTTPLINGDYVIATALNNTNSVIINVNVTTIGTYTIATGLINGIQFTGTGTFTTTGAQTITLFGSGTPELAITAVYSPGTNGCAFNITATTAAVTPVAVFTTLGAPATCTTPVINGIYAPGVALTSSNTVVLGVNVTTAGAYNVTSTAVDGITFSGSGTLAVGAQTITLTGTGTPTSAGPAVFTPVTNGCSFTITVSASGGTSVFTYNGAPGACTTPVVAGTYTAGFPLTASNTLTITANVTTAGTYSISTNTVNGMTFTASGTIAVGTSQTIVLIGSGTPTAANTSSFSIAANGCTFPITTVAPPAAAFTYGGGTGVCSPITIDGTYNTGNALTATANTATIQVNVTTAGTYTITTNTVNGYSFSSTGVFPTTGAQTVALGGSGTPVAVGTDNFTVTGGCTFNVPVTVPSSPCTGLMDGKFDMTGQFTLNGFSFGIATGSGTYQVTIQQSPLQLDVFFPGDNPPAPGTYSIGTVTMHSLYISGPTAIDWNATSGSVYVSTSGGQTVVEFCNVSFSGTNLGGGANLSSTGAGKMVF
ncbi:MAG: hypothetical protein ABI402_06955 [Ferruginibacter sp.]